MSTPVQLTPSERGAFAHFFALADPQSTGSISGNSAVSFFALSGLPSPVLGTIWSIADKDNQGLLQPPQFSIALRLIGHAQSGKIVTDDLAQQPGPMPTFKGITLPAHLSSGAVPPSRSSSTMVPPVNPNPAAGADIRPEDRARYTRIFTAAGPQNGLLEGEKAKEIFVKSKLPFDKLGAIWNLADTKARGNLDLVDFIIGMHFIQGTMNGSLSSIPATLPSGLYEKASGAATGHIPMSAQHTGGSASGFISSQVTGASQFGSPGSPVTSKFRSPTSTPVPTVLQTQRTGSNTPFAVTQGASSDWDVTQSEKVKADQYFDGLDQDRKGILEGQAAVPFFMQSGLNEMTLAHIWDLSDITQSGSLTRDEFAVAMHLINVKLTGGEVPQELPQNLIPPALRGTKLPQAVNPQETDTQRDLFSLMDDDVELPVSTATAFATPAGTAPAAGNAFDPSASVPSTSKGAFDSAFDDNFLGTNKADPTPSTGGGILPAAVGAGALGMAAGAAVPHVLSSQNTGEGDRSITQSSSNINQNEGSEHRSALETAQRNLSDVESSKESVTKSIASDANSVSDLKTRLETVRMRHQTESEAVSALRERQKVQIAELKKLQEDSVREESELSRLKAEKDEIEQALMKDREDVREMKRIVGEHTKQKETLKAEIEKLKKEARQQKGLVAIGKKQLSQAENDVQKSQQELEQTRLTDSKEPAALEHTAYAEAPTAPDHPEAPREAITSPALSTRSNNPFDRLTPSQTGGGHSGVNAAALAGAGVAGAAGAGIGVAALSHGRDSSKASSPAGKGVHEESDPFFVKPESTAQDESHPETIPATTETQADFDDDFGQSVPEQNDQHSVPNENPNQSFENAFADVDQPHNSGSDISSENKNTEPQSKVFEHEGSDPDAVHVPGSFDEAQRPEDEGEDQQNPPHDFTDLQKGSHDSSDSQGAAPDLQDTGRMNEARQGSNDPWPSTSEPGGISAVNNANSESSDEDDGPEDFEGGKHRGAAVSGEEDGPASLEENQITGAHAESAAQAADRFPEVKDEDSVAQPNSSSSGSTSAYPTATTAALGGAAAAAGVAGVAGIAATGTSAPLTASHSGTSDADAFHDAFNDIPATGHEKYSTAAESTPESSSIPTQARSASPIKTRRAPPAIPVRGNTSNATAQPINAGPFAGATPAQSADNAVDDFDAAFEDLGPSTAQNADISHAESSVGFDDAFGDADGFDFVPSFSSNNVRTQTGSVISPSTATAPDRTFDGFDSAFDGAFEPVTQASTSAGIAASSGQIDSNPDSAFGADDFAIPPEAISTGKSPTKVTNDLPPATPARPDASARDPAAALPDDAGPVKQLCSMGFSRPQVIQALEKSNYRTEKALEKLLAQSS